MSTTETAVRKRYSAQEIVGKLAQASALRAQGNKADQIAAELGISVATLYNWRRTHTEVDDRSITELERLRRQNTRLRRALAELEQAHTALRTLALGKF